MIKKQEEKKTNKQMADTHLPVGLCPLTLGLVQTMVSVSNCRISSLYRGIPEVSSIEQPPITNNLPSAVNVRE
jgi:hypothetical protein